MNIHKWAKGTNKANNDNQEMMPMSEESSPVILTDNSFLIAADFLFVKKGIHVYYMIILQLIN